MSEICSKIGDCMVSKPRNSRSGDFVFAGYMDEIELQFDLI